MGIEEFKRWHWIAIGLVVGAVLAYTRLQFEPGGLIRGRATTSALEFTANLQRKTVKDGAPFVSDVVIYPPYENKTLVTFLMVPPDVSGVVFRKPYQFYADSPFHVGRGAAPRQDYTIRDHVDEIARKNASVKYRFAWWTLPWAIVLLWGGVPTVLIGGLWPVLLNIMIGAGFGRPKRAEAEYDLERFKGGPEPAKPAARRGATASDHQQVREFADSLEKDLAAKASPSAAPTELIAADAAQAVRKLDAGPLESSTAAAKPQEAKDYKGEYYPVVRPHGHETEQSPPSH